MRREFIHTTGIALEDKPPVAAPAVPKRLRDELKRLREDNAELNRQCSQLSSIIDHADEEHNKCMVRITELEAENNKLSDLVEVMECAIRALCSDLTLDDIEAKLDRQMERLGIPSKSCSAG